MKITINPVKDESYYLEVWPVSDEPPRVALDANGKSYQLINTGEGVVLEIYDLDKDGQITEFVGNIDLPK